MLDKLNLAMIWAAITGTVGVVLWMFSTFATASEVQDIRIGIAYGQFYDRLDDFDEAVAEDNEDLADEYARQMEQLLALICEHDPEFKRCKGADDE